MNSHANRDCCIVPKRSSAFGEPGRMRASSKVQQIGNHRWRPGQGAQNNMQVWPMSREEPREKISRQPATRAVQPSAQTNSEAAELVMNTKKAKLQLQIIMLCIETHMMQVGVWGKAKKVVEDTGGVALPPSGAARSQVDQGRRRGYHKMKLQNYHSATIKCTKNVNSSITAQLWRPRRCHLLAGRPNGRHITTVLPPIRERLSSNAKQGVMENKTYYHWHYPFPHQLWANLVCGSHRCSCNLRAVGVDSVHQT